MDRILEESGVEKIVKTEEIFEYVQKQYGTVPEYLWSKSPDSAVLRHKNGKWYAVFMTVEKSKLRLEGNDLVDIMHASAYSILPSIAGGLDSSFNS